jgi:hypothetical protein
MATGYYRVYSPEDPGENPFWCCVGTGMEDLAKIADQIYLTEGDKIIVAQWISSDLSLPDGRRLEMRVDFKAGKISFVSSGDLDIRLRIPRWVKNMSGDFTDISLKDGEAYSELFGVSLEVHSLPDAASAVWFSRGPSVLCVPLGDKHRGENAGAGIDVYAPAWKVVGDMAVRSDIIYGRTIKAVLESEYLTLPEGENLESFKDHLEKYISVSEGRFILNGLTDHKGGKISLPLIPYADAGNERYGIFWYLKKGSV